MAKQAAQVQVGGWNCTCTIEQSAEEPFALILEFTPNLQAIGGIRASYRSTLSVQVELLGGGLRDLRTTNLRASWLGGRVLVVGRLDDVRSKDVRAVLIEFGGDTQRIACPWELPGFAAT